MVHDSLARLIRLADLPESLLDDVQFEGEPDPLFPTPYRVAVPGAASIAAAGLAVANLWTQRGGERQAVRVDLEHAAAAMRSNHYLKIDGELPRRPRDAVTGFYRTLDGWIYLHCNFPNLRDANLRALDAPADREQVAAAVAQWRGEELESAIVAAGGCGAFVRPEADWLKLPAAQHAATPPVLEIIRIGDAPPEPLPMHDRPLSGVRVLDLTRVLAGPTCGRTLAEQGADVLRVSGRGMADSGMFDLDTGLGKLSTFIDLREPAGVDTLRELVRSGDVFSQAYRPGSLAARGFSPEALAELRPGIVYVTLSAWGHLGPWAGRRGYDTVVQAANGMAWRPDGAQPAFLPVSVQDYVAGYLMAFGATVALARRAQQGGSWMVRVSLAGVGHWVRQHGLVDLAAGPVPSADRLAQRIDGFCMESASPAGRLTHLAPAARLARTPGRWDRPAVELGAHPARWPDRLVR